MSAANASLPPTSELFRQTDFAKRHEPLLTDNRVRWAVRHRAENGLEAAGAVFTDPYGVVLIHEPRFLAWFVGLAGRAKPRAPRRLRQRATAAA
jgi:hypothetical protein